jgi:uncharacterized membrane protein YgcG
MKRRLFLLGLTASASVLMTNGAALAASFSEDVVAQLVQLGFSDITAETTLLGRIRIVARRGDGVREIVLNPRTGEVLRDTWLPSAGSATTRRTVISDVADSGDDTSEGVSSSGDGSSSGGDDNSGGGDDNNSGSGGGRGDRDDDRDDNRDDRDDDKDDKED